MITELDHHTVRPLVPARPAHGHKGTFGHCFILAGSRGFTGAAKLACQAACRSGVGLVTVGVPYPLGDIIATALTETMSIRLPATETESFAHDALEPALRFAQDKEATVIGPGLSRHPDTTAFVLDFVPQCPGLLLLDADGLNALSENPNVLNERQEPCVLTPHPGEMARLIDSTPSTVQKNREPTAAAFAEKAGCVLVLKGQHTVIAAPDGRTAVNPTGNSGLGSGGTGDVLSGLIGGLLAQGMEPYAAACLGVYLHGLAGDIAAQQKTPRAMIATDVIDALSSAWREIEA